MSNVYKRYAPVRLSFNVCDALIKNSFGVTAVTTTNGNVTLCPVKKVSYATLVECINVMITISTARGVIISISL